MQLTSSEVKAVLRTCEDTPQGIRDRAILTLMAFCGLRAVEAHRADLKDLRTKEDRLVLYVQGKGSIEKDDFVVIPRSREGDIMAWVSYHKKHFEGDPLFVSLSNRSRGTRLALRSIRSLVKERFERAGVVGESKTTHSLRHSAITSVLKNGGTPFQAQSMARHSSFDTTLNYVHEVGRLENPGEDLINYD